MKKLLTSSILLLLAISLWAQMNESISIKLGYPIPVGNNFLNGSEPNLKYKGIADIGIDYSFYRTNNLEVGILFNAMFLRLDMTDVNLMMLTPKLKMDYNINLKHVTIKPQLNVGYSHWQIRQDDYLIYPGEGEEYMVIEGSNENYNGFSAGLASKVILNTNRRLNWYLEVGYEFSRLEKPSNDIVNNSYNRNLGMVYPRIGVIWNFRKS